MDFLKPQQLHINGLDSKLFKHAVKNFRVNTLVVHKALLSQIAEFFVKSREPISTVVGYGLIRSRTITDAEVKTMDTVKTLAIYAHQLSYLDEFTKVTRLQILRGGVFKMNTRIYSRIVELAVEWENLLPNLNGILCTFPSLKRIHITTDPQKSSQEVLNQLNGRNIQVYWPLHVPVEQLAHVPYHHFYYQTGNTMAITKLSNVMYHWPSTSTSLEYELDLYSRLPEYIYPSSIDYPTHWQTDRLNEQKIVQRIVNQARSTSTTLRFITKTSILPYWKIVDLCLEYQNKDLLLDVLRRLEDRHLMTIKPRVICNLIEFYGLLGLINIIGDDVFHLLANSQNFKGTTLAHKLVTEHCRIDLNEIDPFIENWNLVNNEGIAPINIALKTLDLSVIMFLLQRGAKLSSTHNVPFQYKYLPFWIQHLPDTFLEKNATEMLFHEDWLRSGASLMNALDTMADYGADVRAFNWRHQSFLNFIISFYGCYPEKAQMSNLIQRLVTTFDVDINQLDGNGDTPLGTAIKTANLKIIKLILQLGANVNDICSNNMKPISFICSSVNNINEFKCLIDCLVEAGADVNATDVQFSECEDDREISPLLLIMERRASLPFIEHLVARGAKLDYVDSQGVPLLCHFLHKTSSVDWYNRAARLLQQKFRGDFMEIEDAPFIPALPSLTQISPQTSEEILSVLFK